MGEVEKWCIAPKGSGEVAAGQRGGGGVEEDDQFLLLGRAAIGEEPATRLRLGQHLGVSSTQREMPLACDSQPAQPSVEGCGRVEIVTQ